ncbi:MAG: hypothetical protein K9J16_16085 [Melioribacteraceae bacterium]|nr:hypothetical protein [Melioribacteraceae bacterium]MCF8356147.1 hypothetical protein [Melioribacteraceae bacterium]MCF8395623.1 hypothetical protein [Melioribacteraceae bacterium]MCF8420874.1 hypothetical protein [Melioribacteraceae bacterium]
MIEIKLPSSAAVQLLTERMNIELDMRKKSGKINADRSLPELPTLLLMEIAEHSAFDLVAFLPLDILTEESNLDEIVAKTIRSVARLYNAINFTNYSQATAASLLFPLRNVLRRSEKDESYKNN